MSFAIHSTTSKAGPIPQTTNTAVIDYSQRQVIYYSDLLSTTIDITNVSAGSPILTLPTDQLLIGLFVNPQNGSIIRYTFEIDNVPLTISSANSSVVLTTYITELYMKVDTVSPPTISLSLGITNYTGSTGMTGPAGSATNTGATGPTGTIGFINRTTVATGTYTVQTTDVLLGVSFTPNASVIITLPNLNTVSTGKTLFISDEGGNASNNNITVNSFNGSQTIGGSTGVIMNLDYMALGLYAVPPSNWYFS